MIRNQTKPIPVYGAYIAGKRRIDCYYYKGWQIEQHGGFCTVKTWAAYNYNGDYFWQSTRKEVIAAIDAIGLHGTAKRHFGHEGRIYLSSLY